MRRWLLILLLAGACGGKKPPTGPAITPEPDDVTDPQALREDLEATFRESMISLANDYDDLYLDGLVRDKRLTIVDVNPGDVVLGFDVEAVSRRRLFPERAYVIDVQDLDVALSADRTSAWSFAHLSYRVFVDGRRATIPLRSTALFERKEGRWLKVVEHVSYGVSDVRALADAAAGKSAPPKEIADRGDTGKEAAEVRSIVETSLGGGASAAVVVSVGDEALLLGSDPTRELRGADIAQVVSPAALYAGSEVTAKDLRVGFVGSKSVAFVLGNLTVGSGGFALGVRATWILEKRAEGWRIVQTHVSVPVPRTRLALEVFGDPEIDPREGE
jgi:ketosteroid isomerase-like protein